MTEMTRRRVARGMTKQELSYAARVPATTIGQIESGRFKPYRPQLERIAHALRFKGDPMLLLAEPEDEPAAAPAEAAAQ